ncbi:CopG family transcriptional regulator [Pseudomonas sp. IT-P253]|jgi:hypothetical protein|uniref:hypothetical protein n=1 Tax=Pseudomonas sp. IT-P253 TaxID=3026455 RepID=UPI0039E122D7
MPPKYQSLLLEQRVEKHANAALHVRETSLKLSDDQREVILSRYVEHYSHDDVEWVESSHRVSVTDMLNWLTSHGEPQAQVQGNDTSRTV